jgi:copper oxidase (laccase) domain-containing protein
VDVVAERREALARLEPLHDRLRFEAGVGGRLFCTGAQVHGSEVAVASYDSGGFYDGADGLVTADPRVCLGVYAADCCAVFLVDPVSRCIGLVHSGAKGSALGIVGVAIRRMQDTFHSRPGNVSVLLSPCIRPPLYEVDFAAQIREQCREAGVGAIIDPKVCTGQNLDRYYSYRMEAGRTGRMLALLALSR